MADILHIRSISMEKRYENFMDDILMYCVLLTESRIVLKILCLNTKVMVPNIKEKAERTSRRIFLVENMVKITIIQVSIILSRMPPLHVLTRQQFCSY